MRNPTITVLLATYQGERYLTEQLASIDAQTGVEWRLVARDDGSTDGTVQLLERWCAGRDGATLLVDGDHLGAARSFLRLLAEVETDLFAFADQDDIWDADKLSRAVDHARAQGYLDGRSDHPWAVATDARMVDDAGAPLGTTLLAARGAGFSTPSLGELLMLNVAMGATMVGSAALARAAADAGDAVTDLAMHDWWCAAVASAAGSFSLLAEPTMSYRQHAESVTPEHGAGVGHLLSRLRQGPVDRAHWILARSAAIARGLQALEAGPTPTSSDAAAVDAVAAIQVDRPTLAQVRAAARVGAKMRPRSRQLALQAGVAIGRLRPSTQRSGRPER